MKKIAFLTFFLLFVTTIFSQQYQRMLVSKDFIGSLKPGESKEIDAICLDYGREAPPNGVSLNSILINAKSAKVIKNGKYFSLKTLIDKGEIEIKGSGSYENILIKNNTGESLKLDFGKDVQFSTSQENPAKVHSYNQTEHWVAEMSIYLGYKNFNDFKSKNDINYDGNAIETLKEKFFNKRYKKYKKRARDELQKTKDEIQKINNKYQKQLEDCGYNYYSQLHEYIDKTSAAAYEKTLKKALENQAKYLKILRENNIGLKGNNPKKIVSELNKALHKNYVIRDNLFNEIEKAIKEEFEAGTYFIWKNGKYVRHTKSPRIGILYKTSEYVKRNIKALEERLFQTKFNKDEAFVLNFIDKSESTTTYEAFLNSFENYSDLSLNALDEIEKMIKAKKIKYLFCFGHFGLGKDKKGKVISKMVHKKGKMSHRYPIEMIDKIAETLNIEVFYIGCESACVSDSRVGTARKTNSMNMIKALSISLEKSKTLGDFLKNLAEESMHEFTFVLGFDEQQNVIIRVFKTEKNRYGGDGGNNNNNGGDGGNGNGNDRNNSFTYDEGSLHFVLRSPSFQQLIPSGINGIHGIFEVIEAIEEKLDSLEQNLEVREQK